MTEANHVAARPCSVLIDGAYDRRTSRSISDPLVGTAHAIGCRSHSSSTRSGGSELFEIRLLGTSFGSSRMTADASCLIEQQRGNVRDEMRKAQRHLEAAGGEEDGLTREDVVDTPNRRKNGLKSFAATAQTGRIESSVCRRFAAPRLRRSGCSGLLAKPLSLC
jgi:hypothetical protein